MFCSDPDNPPLAPLKHWISIKYSVPAHCSIFQDLCASPDFSWNVYPSKCPRPSSSIMMWRISNEFKEIYQSEGSVLLLHVTLQALEPSLIKPQYFPICTPSGTVCEVWGKKISPGDRSCSHEGDSPLPPPDCPDRNNNWQVDWKVSWHHQRSDSWGAF